MTVKEYLEIHNGDDIKSIGIYSAAKIKDEFDRDTDVIDTEVATVDLVHYLDRIVDHVHLFIYTEIVHIQRIRACICVK